MVNNIFFDKKKDFFTLAEVLEITNSHLVNGVEVDLNKKILGTATIDKANHDQISFINSGAYSDNLKTTKAGFVLLEEKYLPKLQSNTVGLINKNPYFAYANLINNFYKSKGEAWVGISENAHIAKSAQIGSNATIMPGAYIGHHVKIGDNCFIGANAIIMDYCQIKDNAIIHPLAVISHAVIGNNVIIHNGAKIGQDGFGFAHDRGVNHKILQLGGVIIGDDVEIGANSCIDRGAIEDTVIGNGVKIDNLVQIAHNVIIGDGSVFAGASAVAGSARIGRFVQVGGHASIGGHLTVGDGAKIAGKSGIAKDVKPMETVGGSPAMPIREWHRLNFKLMQLIGKKDSE